MSWGVIFVWEMMGTALLTLLGCGVVANVALRNTLGTGGGWLLINFGWGFAVFVGASVAAPTDGHINPAVTLGLAANGQLDWSLVPVYVLAQLVGGTLGGILCWAAYKLQFDHQPEPQNTRGIFCTGPTISGAPWNLVTEFVGTFVLLLWIIQSPGIAPAADGTVEFGNSALGYAGVMFVVIGIGNSLGGPTGYAINPARDLGPRIAYAILPIKGKGSAEWGYSWIPVVGPLLGGVAAGLLGLVLPAT